MSHNTTDKGKVKISFDIKEVMCKSTENLKIKTTLNFELEESMRTSNEFLPPKKKPGGIKDLCCYIDNQLLRGT